MNVPASVYGGCAGVRCCWPTMMFWNWPTLVSTVFMNCSAESCPLTGPGVITPTAMLMSGATTMVVPFWSAACQPCGHR